MIRPAHAVLLLTALLAACASAPPSPPAGAPATHFPPPFSTATWTNGLPEGWRVYRLLRFKPLTKFEPVRVAGTQVVHASAHNSVSGIDSPVSIDPKEFPLAEWRWRVPKLIEDADNTEPARADSPARVVFTFEGGREQLPPAEQLNYDLAKALTGNALPFATLMYIWEPGRKVGEILTHHNSTRVKMVVAANATADLAVWHEAKVNVLEDYRRAFGEDPPRIKTVGIMSDSDNTGSTVEAFFGDIRFLPKQ